MSDHDRPLAGGCLLALAVALVLWTIAAVTVWALLR
jgi:hypothetical protein